MAQEGVDNFLSGFDRVVMAAQPCGGLAALEGGAGSVTFGASPSGTINPEMAYASRYRGVQVPEHLRDALNRMARR